MSALSSRSETQRGWQVREGNQVGTAEGVGALDHVHQFADVSWPGIVLESGECAGVDLSTAGIQPLTEVGEKILHKQRDVFTSLAQGGKKQGVDVETVVQILA